jgi:omega-6 fatty acid desaturase (delta-12 desaturase)
METTQMPVKDARGKRLVRALRRYHRPNHARAVGQVANSVLPYLALWWAAYFLLGVSYWLSLAAAVFAAGFLVRVFIISHDCGHGSFFRSRRANDMVGAFTSFLVFLPYYRWRREHSIHHANAGDLDNRGVGDINTLTVKEYMALPRWGRMKYRLYRNPIVMFLIGPLYVFVVSYRFAPRRSTRREYISVIRTNVMLGLVIAAAALTIGIKAYVLVQLPIMAIAGMVGVWLFYIQHQFEDVYWERNDRWDFVSQALNGSSYYQLPRILQWFSGNIGFHHIHHLSSRIPNYYLPRVQAKVPDVQQVPRITFLGSFRSLAFRLFDEERRRLVGFSRVRELRKFQQTG